jgi:uncharacterized protein (DUF697 family)/predicted GTPase
MGNQRAKLMKKFEDEIEEFKGYDPMVLEDVENEYVDAIFRHYEASSKQGRGIRRIKIMILGKAGHGKSHMVNMIVKRVVAPTNAESDPGPAHPREYIIKRNNIELSLIDVDGHGEGIEYLTYKDKIRALIYIHRPSVVWYSRESSDFRMSEIEIIEFLVFNELQASVVLILNQIDDSRKEKIIAQWRTNFESKGADAAIKAIIGIPFIEQDKLNQNVHIKNLVQETLKYAIDMNQMIESDPIMKKTWLENTTKVAKKKIVIYSLLCSTLSLAPLIDIVLIVPVFFRMIYVLCGLFNFKINYQLANNILKLFIWRIIAYIPLSIALDFLAFIPFAGVAALAINASITFGLTLKLGLSLLNTLQNCVRNNIDLSNLNERTIDELFKTKFVEQLDEINKLTIDQLKQRVELRDDVCITCMDNRPDIKNLPCGHSTFCRMCLPTYFNHGHNKCSRCQTNLNVNLMKQTYKI